MLRLSTAFVHDLAHISRRANRTASDLQNNIPASQAAFSGAPVRINLYDHHALIAGSRDSACGSERESGPPEFPLFTGASI